MVAALLLAFLHHAPDLRPGRDESVAAAAPLAAAIEERLEADAELLQRVAARIPADLTARDAASAFDVLANAYETLPLRGRGLRLGTREAGTVAWYGKILGEPEGELLASFRVGPVPARLVRRERAVGAVLRTTAGGWTVELEDLWVRRSPVEALGVPPGGWLAAEAARRGVGIALGRAPEGGGDVVAGPGAPLVVAGAPVGRLLGEPLGAEPGASPTVFRFAALLLLASFALLVAGRWRELGRESAAASTSGASPGSEHGAPPSGLTRLPPLVEKALMVVGVRLLLEAGDLLDVLVPGPLSSPLSFAAGLLGPFTRSPIDFLATALLAALLAGEVLREAVRRPARPNAARAGNHAVLVLLVALVAAAGLARQALVDAGAPLVRDTSAELLFDPTLYSRPEGAVLFAALAASAGALLLLLASAFASVAGGGSGRRAPLTARALGWSAPGAVLLCAAAGVALAREGAGVSGGLLAFLLAFSAILGGLALAGLAARVVRGGPAQIRAQAAAAALLAVLAASGIATAHGAGRIWALRLFLADRLEEVGSPSNQWIEYNLGLTSERLTGDADLAVRVAEDPEGAAFEAWTRTPLGDLPFLSALLLVDAPGSVLSRFSLLPPQDLELLPGVARAALRAPPGALGRLVSETGRSLLYTGVPVSGAPGAPWAVAVVAEIAEPGLAEESAQYFLQNVFFSGPADPILLAVRRGDPAPPSGRALTLASGSGEERFWISVALGPYLPDLLDHLSLALTAALVTAALFALHRTVLQALPVPTRASLRPLATFRGRVFAVLLALVALPLAVYTLLSFQATRHEIDQATRALAEESLRTAAAFLGPRLQAGGGAAELEAILPEAARLVGQDLLVFRGGTLAASSRPEIFQTGLLDRRMPGELYRRLVFAGDRLVTERAAVGAREVLVAHLRTPWGDAGRPYVLASPLLLRAVHLEHDRRELVQALYVMFVLSLLALGVFSWVVSRQLASPLAALREGADRIARGELAHRLRGPERHDEFGRLFSAFNTMAAGLQVSQGELVAEKGRMQAIVSSIGAGVLALDREGRIQLANRAARELLDLPPDVAGLRPAEVLPPAFWERASRALRLGHRREDEVRLADGDGSRILHLTFAPLVGEGGERRGLVVVFEDLSAVLASQRAVAWEEMARQVAHEIKNPLTPIKLSLQHVGRLLERPPDDLPARLRRTLDLVLSEIGRLERIAGEFSRFGARGRDARPMDPGPVLRDVAALYAPAGGAGVELAVEGAPGLVRAEEDGLRKIVVNLLENAREAMGADGTAEPEILLALRYDAGPGHAEILVRDTGPGIAREDLERLFEPYFSTKTRGTGLGLAIARRIVESWGGTIEARNWDRGAEVVLRLEKSASGPA